MPMYRLRPHCVHYSRSGPRSGVHLNKPGSIIELTESQGKAFQDKFDRVEDTPKEKAFKDSQDKTITENLPAVEETKDGNFDVLHQETGKPINDEPLTEEDANALAETTTEEDDLDDFLKD